MRKSITALLVLIAFVLSGCSAFSRPDLTQTGNLDIDIDNNNATDVAFGGTNAKTAAAARTSLGAAASGANADITSLSGLTTPLTAAQGGVGADTSALSGIAKMTSGVMSAASAGTDYVAPTGSGASLIGIPLDSDFSSNGIMERTAAGVYGIATAGTDYVAPSTVQTIPDNSTATTQSHDDFTTKLATNAFSQTVSGSFGANLLLDPDFDLVAERSLSTWETLTTTDIGPGTFGEYGMGTDARYGVRLEHAGKKYDYIYQRRDIPVILGKTYSLAIHYKADATYVDDGNIGARLQLEILDKDGTQLEVLSTYTGVGTLGSWAWKTDEVTVTETDAAYAAPTLYIYDSGAAGTGYIDVDYVSITEKNSGGLVSGVDYLSPSAISTTYQADLSVPSQAEAEAGTVETERSWNALRDHQATSGYLENQYGHGTYLAAQPSENWIGKTAYVNGYTAGYDPMDLHTSMSYDGAYEVFVATAATWNATNLKLLRLIDGTAYFASLVLTPSTDPDISTAGAISQDSDGANETGDMIWRGYDGTNQVMMGRKLNCFTRTIPTPNDFADALRDKMPIWSNETGMTFTVTKIVGMSDTDDTTLNVEEYDADGASNNATVDALEIATGSGPYTQTETTITGASIEAGHGIWLDFDDTDDPGWVMCTICGWYNANVD